MAAETSMRFWVTLTSGFLAISGIGAKGFADIQLERAKLDSQLIVGALGSPSVEVRRDSLRLLVDTGLIYDKQAKQGLKQYFEGVTPLAPPQVRPFIQSGEVVPLTPSTDENKPRTDMSLFVCGSAKASNQAKEVIGQIHKSIERSNHFGSVTLKVWDGPLYEEIPEVNLAGYSTLVVDSNHPEKNEEAAIREVLRPIVDMPPLRVVKNTRSITPWNLSLVVCPR